MKLRIIAFAFVAHPATEAARSRAFYEGVLGLKPSTSFQQGDQFWIEFKIGPHTLGIGNEPFLKPLGDGPHLVVEVEDFEQASSI